MKRILWLTLAAGCGLRQNDDPLEAAVAADLGELSRSVDAGTGTLGDGVALDLDGQFAGIGDCAWGWTLVGPASGAAYEAAIENTPCGGSISGDRGSIDYAVTLGELHGTVSFAGDGAWDYDLTGERTADTTITSTRRGSTETYTGAWTLESMVGTADGSGRGPFDAVLAYTGWFGGDWGLEWSRSAAGDIAGSLVGPAGRSCTISGTTDDIVVDCPDE